MGCGCGFTRRDVLRAGSLAAAGLLAGARLGAQAKKGMRIDIHAHLWTDDYLDLCQSYGNVDTGTQRNKGAGMGQAEMDKRFALMEANGVEMQILDICPQAPHFENKEHAVNAARKANDLYAEAVSRWPKKFKAFAAVPLPHVDEALKELERALDQLKFVGATIDDVCRKSFRRRSRLCSVLSKSSTGAPRCCTFIRPETASILRS